MSASISEPRYAAIDTATAASNAIVAPVTGKRVRILGGFIIVAASVVVTFEDSDGTNLTGAMTMGEGVVMPISSYLGYMETAVGKGFNMLLGGAVQVSGGVTYVLVG